LSCRAVYKQPPPLMKFGLWNGTPIPSDWLWSEKLDGIRAVHLSEVSFLETRNGGVLSAPEEFMEYVKGFNRLLTRKLQEDYLEQQIDKNKMTRKDYSALLQKGGRNVPLKSKGSSKLDISIMLDGELWAGRERFQELVSAAKTTRNQNPQQEVWSFSSTSKGHGPLNHKHPDELLQQQELKECGSRGTDSFSLLAKQDSSKRSAGTGFWGVYFMIFDFLCPPRIIKKGNKHKWMGVRTGKKGEVARKPTPLEHHVRLMTFSRRYQILQNVHAAYLRERKQIVPVRTVFQHDCSSIRGKTFDTAFDLQRSLLHHKAVDPEQGVPTGNIPEGLMLREPEGAYEQAARSPSVLKVKPYQEYECLCVGVNEGDGRFEGLVGALQAEAVGHDGTIKCFNAGSGLTDSLRINIKSAKKGYAPLMKGRGGYVGRVFTMRCNGYTDGGVPRFPRFICWRPDRDGVEVLLYGSGMQTDIKARVMTCRFVSKQQLGRNKELLVTLRVGPGQDAAGKQFSIGHRGIPEEFRRALRSKEARLEGQVTVEFYSREEKLGCPRITAWEGLATSPSALAKAMAKKMEERKKKAAKVQKREAKSKSKGGTKSKSASAKDKKKKSGKTTKRKK